MLARGDGGRAARPTACSTSHGEVLALRSDMTVPIARVVATRYATAEPPLRFCYFAHSYRGVRPQRGQPREFLQAGIELVGAPGAGRDRRGADACCAARSTPPGCATTASASATPSLYPALLRPLGVAGEAARARCCATLGDARLRRPGARARALGLDDARREPAAARRRSCAAARRCSTRSADRSATRPTACAPCTSCSRPRSPRASIFDLGLVRDLGYYTGAVFEVYDPALGAPLGGGGRYDDLLGRFGRPLPAVGFALGVDRLHLALAGEEAVSVTPTASTIAVPRGALFGETLDAARRARPRHRRGARQRPQAAVRGRRRRHDAPLRRADLRRGRRGRPRHHRQGRPHGAVRARRLRAARPRLRALHDGAGDRRRRPDPAAEALRRLGVMRVATKYPQIAARYFEDTGRQAEIVEVKGSVELAPLTGLVEAIVDLTATGTTLRENGLVVREEIVVSTARLIANPVAHKLKARRSTTSCERLRDA